MQRRDFGQVRRQRSGRWQARWKLSGVWHTGRRVDTENRDLGPLTFSTKRKAEEHLSWIRTEIEAGRWTPPIKGSSAAPLITLREYADAWLVERDLEATTRDHYRQVLDEHILPAFGDDAVNAVTPAAVRTWHASLARAKGSGRNATPDRPTARAHAYGLLRTIMNTAVADETISANPCRIRGAGQAKRVKQIRPASLAELEALTTAMPERYQLLILLASWCGLRQGELFELRRGDVDVKNGVLHVRRGVVRTSGGRQVKGPKSDAGKRDVAIPPHLLDAVTEHLRQHAQTGREGLLFPAKGGGHMAPSSLYGREMVTTKAGKVTPGWGFYAARQAAGRTDLRFHDLRHTGAVLAAATGATLAELMARLGHSTPGAALRYQHAAAERDRAIADALSKLVTDNVTPIESARSAKNSRRRKEGAG